MTCTTQLEVNKLHVHQLTMSKHTHTQYNYTDVGEKDTYTSCEQKQQQTQCFVQYNSLHMTSCTCTCMPGPLKFQMY